jgi:hypothetical protein
MALYSWRQATGLIARALRQSTELGQGRARVLRWAPMEPSDDAGGDGGSRRGTPTPTTLLPLLRHTAPPNKIRWCCKCARARGLPCGWTQCWRSSSSLIQQEHSAWEPASSGRLLGCWSINGGFPSDDGLTSIVACAGAATSHATMGEKPGVVDAEVHSSHQGGDATTPPWPMSPALASTNVGATTLGDTTIGATTDGVNHTPSPQTTSADRRLKRFTERITKMRHPPLLELPGDDTTIGGRAPPSLPKQSRRIAAQSIAHIPTSKRGKHLVLKCLGLTGRMSSPSTLALMAYDEIFSVTSVICRRYVSCSQWTSTWVRASSAATARQLGHRPPSLCRDSG